jgi:hypothetical protein
LKQNSPSDQNLVAGAVVVDYALRFLCQFEYQTLKKWQLWAVEIRVS